MLMRPCALSCSTTNSTKMEQTDLTKINEGKRMATFSQNVEVKVKLRFCDTTNTQLDNEPEAC